MLNTPWRKDFQFSAEKKSQSDRDYDLSWVARDTLLDLHFVSQFSYSQATPAKKKSKMLESP
jgi:hypothetical protein